MNEMVENKKKTDILSEAFIQVKYGEMITHKEISSLIHETHGTQKYNTIVQKAKNIAMKLDGAVFESIRGDGYRRINPDDYVKHSLGHYRRGFREIQKGCNTLNCAPVDKMTEEGRSIYKRVSDRVVLLDASLRGSMVELKTLGEKRHPFLPQNINR